MLALAWLVVIMPQQRRVRAHQAVVAALHEGDEVMTTSGILGTIKTIDGDVLRVEVAPDVELRVVKGAVARRRSPPSDVRRTQHRRRRWRDIEAASATEE